MSEIDHIDVTKLIKKYGSPLFVFSERQMRAKAVRTKEAFSSRYNKVGFAWSYKTNYLNAICRIFHDEGWIAEVVSEFEYEKARKLGIEGKNILFNGPCKPDDILRRAIAEGALIQIDNWDELMRVEAIVPAAKRPVEVGVRVWMDVGIRPVWTKFGFAVGNGEAARAVARIVRNKKLRLHTLHTHIGTYVLAPEAYCQAMQKLIALREQILLETGHLVACINIGGGIPSNSLLHGMIGPAEHSVPQIEYYADAITRPLNKLPERKRPLLHLEMGRHLIDEAGYLLTTIVATKARNLPPTGNSDLSAREAKELLVLQTDAKRGLVIDAGFNILYTAAWFEIGVWPSRLIRKPPTPTRIYGSLCMAIDVIRENVDLPALDTGDVLTLHPVGAYNISQSMQFISYRPAVVLIGDDGSVDIIRQRETLEDIEHLERVPPRLAK
jgi:diaminopimelate decarboxylase